MANSLCKEVLPLNLETIYRGFENETENLCFEQSSVILIPSPLWPHPNPGGHDLNTIKSTLPEEASTKVSGFCFFFCQIVVEKIFCKIPTNVLYF